MKGREVGGCTQTIALNIASRIMVAEVGVAPTALWVWARYANCYTSPLYRPTRGCVEIMQKSNELKSKKRIGIFYETK